MKSTEARGHNAVRDVWPPAPLISRPAARTQPILTKYQWLDKLIGLFLAGIPAILVEFVLPLFMDAAGTRNQVGHHLGQPEYYIPFAVFIFLCFAVQIAIYQRFLPRLPWVASGFGLGLWIWTPILILIVVLLPVFSQVK